MNERTKREMAAGAAIAARHAAQRLEAHPEPRPNPRSTITKNVSSVPWSYPAVFRPIDYVPSQAKGQGYIKVLS